MKVPRIDTLRRRLPLYFSLRYICMSESRELRIAELDMLGLKKNSWSLSYKFPKGVEKTGTGNGSIDYGGQSHPVQVQVMRSPVILDTPGKQGATAQGGFLISGKHAIYDHSMFKFEGNDSARHLLGTVECPSVDDVLKSDSSLVKATRDGLDYAHSFAMLLRQEVERLLEPYVKAQQRLLRERERKTLSVKLERKLKDVVKQLNDIAVKELEDEPGVGLEPKNPLAPKTGFGFVPELYHVVSGSVTTLLLRGLSSVVGQGTVVRLSSDNAEVPLAADTVTLEERPDFPWLVEAKVRAEGKQVNNLAVITAHGDGNEAEAIVEVVAERKPSGPSHPRPKPGGFFNECTFDDSKDPPYRVRYDRSTGDIVVYTDASTVKPYCPLANPEQLDNSPQAQVLLAELVLEAACYEIVRKNVETGKSLLPTGTEADALENEHRKFRQRYGGVLHAVLVDDVNKSGFEAASGGSSESEMAH